MVESQGKKKRKKRGREFFLHRPFSRSMTNFEATTSKQDAAYLHRRDKRDAHASRVRIIFPTIVRYGNNRWWFGTTTSCRRFLSLSFSFHLSHDRSMTDRKVLRRSYLQVFLIIDQPLLTRYRFPIKSILVTSNTSRFTLLVTFEAIGKNN